MNQTWGPSSLFLLICSCASRHMWMGYTCLQMTHFTNSVNIEIPMAMKVMGTQLLWAVIAASQDLHCKTLESKPRAGNQTQALMWDVRVLAIYAKHLFQERKRAFTFSFGENLVFIIIISLICHCEFCKFERLAFIFIGTYILIPEVSYLFVIYSKSVLLVSSYSIWIKMCCCDVYCWQCWSFLDFCLCVLMFFFRQVVGYGKKWSPIPLLLGCLLVLGLDIASLYMGTNAICLVAWQMKVKIQTIMFLGMVFLRSNIYFMIWIKEIWFLPSWISKREDAYWANLCVFLVLGIFFLKLFFLVKSHFIKLMLA